MYVAAYHQEFTVDETKDASTKPKKKETPKSTERKDEYEAESKQAGVSLSSTVRGKTNVFGANFYQNRLEGNSYTRGGYRITPKGEYLYLISKDYEAVKLDPTTFKNEKATITLNGKQYTISYELV